MTLFAKGSVTGLLYEAFKLGFFAVKGISRAAAELTSSTGSTIAGDAAEPIEELSMFLS
jgi:hypothetical protein